MTNKDSVFLVLDNRFGSYSRVPTGFPALDRVLGGGLVEGSTTLLAGRPNTGKRMLTLQVLDWLGCRCLYVTGEETREQVAATAQRIGALSSRIYVLSERRLGVILEHAHSMRAQVIAIDTIQTLTWQLRTCMKRLLDYAKTTNTTLWLVDLLTSDGSIAGPKTIEHDVDVVLELDQEGNERILRCPSKNRFGPTNIVGRLTLTAGGLVEADEEARAHVEASHGAC
jgi:DNA repair protein RadA/Sms